MSFGISFSNNQDVVVLDSEFSRLCVIASGRYVPNDENGLGSYTTFPIAVTSQEPPLVFVRPDTGGQAAGVTNMRLTGSPGNWTGFYIRAYNINTAQPNGRYFVGAFGAQAVASFGMRLWDGTTKLLFDSGTASAGFTRSFINWTYVKSERSPTTSYVNYYTVPFNFPENEYLMINSFGMNLLSGDNVGRTIRTLWDFPAGTLWALTESFNNPFDFHLPAIFAKING